MTTIRQFRYGCVVTVLSFFASALQPTCVQADLRFIFSEEVGFGAGSGLGQFSSPSGLAIGDFDRDGYPDIIVADSGNNRIQRVNFNTPTGDPDFDLIADSGSDVGKLVAPKGLDVDTQRGLIFVADTGNNRIQRLSVIPAGQPGAGPPEVIVGPGSGLGQVNGPQGVAYDEANDRLYIADTLNNRIQRATFDPITGDPDFDLLMAAGTGLGEVSAPAGVTKQRRSGETSLGDFIFIADTGNNRIQRAAIDPITGDPDFDLLMSAGTALGEVMAPKAASAFGRTRLKGNTTLSDFIIVADTGNNRVQMGIDDGNNVNWQFIGGGAISMLAPEGLAVGDINRDGRPDLLVADSGNNRLLLFAGVPEPSTAALAALAGMALAAVGRARRV